MSPCFYVTRPSSCRLETRLKTFLVMVCPWLLGHCLSFTSSFSMLKNPSQSIYRIQQSRYSNMNPLFSIPIDSNQPQQYKVSKSFRLARYDREMIRNWSLQTLSIGIPALLGLMADPLLSLIDTAYVGKLGSLPLAALGTCTSIFHVAFNAFRGTTTVTTSLVATALASSSSNVDCEDTSVLSTTEAISLTDSRASISDEFVVTDAVRLIIQTSIRYGLNNGILLALVLWYFGRMALRVMGIPSSSPLFGPAFTYLQIRSLAAPAVLFSAVAEGAFRGYTDSTTPLLASSIAALANIVLDPLMMFTMNMGVGGAAWATVISQYAAAILYGVLLIKRKMLALSYVPFWNYFSLKKKRVRATIQRSQSDSDSKTISETITQANLSMFTKQGSLLFAWAYATACATRLGHVHVAAHQVALSLWLFFVLIIDGAAISAQILMSKTFGPLLKSHPNQPKSDEPTIRRNVRMLCYFMSIVAIVQGLLTTGAILWFGRRSPHLFTTDANIQRNLMRLIPHLAWQQVLISLVLVLESLVVGANQFGLLAFGTTISTLVAVKNIHYATDIVSIWSHGIVSLFLGRLLTSVLGILKINGTFDRWKRIK